MLLNMGDTIACKVQNPQPAELKATLNTWAAVMLGQKLIDSGDWYLLPPPINT